MMKRLKKSFPEKPGVYIFKDKNNHILYIGKAKNLKKRINSYFQKKENLKINTLVESSSKIDYIQTSNELEAMLLEAKLIQANKPKFNVLLKSGQPFLYMVFTSHAKKLPTLEIVRNKKKKGIYFGPFIEKTPTRIVYDFLLKTFKLKLCRKKIENGCLDYHLGICAGSCKKDFNKKNYLQRLELAKLFLKKGHKKFLSYLKEKIKKHNKKMEFEKSQELNKYLEALKKIFQAISTTNISKYSKTLSPKDIWILSKNKRFLFLFSEKSSIIKRKRLFYFPMNENLYLEYFKSYYIDFSCPNTILINFNLIKKKRLLFEQFLKKWHQASHNISIINPKEGHFLNLVRLAQIHANQEIEKQKTTPKALKKLLQLPIEPSTIDCFDISHKQGMFMVGSCIRFKDGKPNKNKFRRFKIKTVEFSNDYACLQEIVKRRYKDKKEVPDLILIDGGKGQLNAIVKILPKAEIISLAKKEEIVFGKHIPQGKKLNIQNYASQLLIALRDYTHHFAVSYHRKISKHSK